MPRPTQQQMSDFLFRQNQMGMPQTRMPSAPPTAQNRMMSDLIFQQPMPEEEYGAPPWLDTMAKAPRRALETIAPVLDAPGAMVRGALGVGGAKPAASPFTQANAMQFTAEAGPAPRGMMGPPAPPPVPMLGGPGYEPTPFQQIAAEMNGKPSRWNSPGDTAAEVQFLQSGQYPFNPVGRTPMLGTRAITMPEGMDVNTPFAPIGPGSPEAQERRKAYALARQMQDMAGRFPAALSKQATSPMERQSQMDVAASEAAANHAQIQALPFRIAADLGGNIGTARQVQLAMGQASGPMPWQQMSEAEQDAAVPPWLLDTQQKFANDPMGFGDEFARRTFPEMGGTSLAPQDLETAIQFFRKKYNAPTYEGGMPFIEKLLRSGGKVLPSKAIQEASRKRHEAEQARKRQSFRWFEGGPTGAPSY